MEKYLINPNQKISKIIRFSFTEKSNDCSRKYNNISRKEI